MVIKYPRECVSCKHTYISCKTFSKHKVHCARYMAENILAKKNEDRVIEQYLHDNPLPEVTQQVAPTPDTTTRIQYLEKCTTFYVVQTAHSFRCGLNVYKIGRTAEMQTRIKGYPKGTIIILQLLCLDATFFEDHIKTLLLSSEGIQPRTDFGVEYFEGDLMSILKLIWNAYDKTGMSPAQVSPDSVDMKAEVDDTSSAIAKVEREYQNMLLEKKIYAIAKHKRQQRDEELSDELVAILNQLKMTPKEKGGEGTDVS